MLKLTDRQTGRQAEAAGSGEKTVVCLCVFGGGASLPSGRESKDSTWCFCRNLPNVRNPLPTPENRSRRHETTGGLLWTGNKQYTKPGKGRGAELAVS